LAAGWAGNAGTDERAKKKGEKRKRTTKNGNKEGNPKWGGIGSRGDYGADKKILGQRGWGGNDTVRISHVP